MRLSKAFILLLSVMFLGITVLTGCSSRTTGGTETAGTSTEQPQTTRTVKHELEEITITGTPSRIVVLEFSFIDALASLGISPVGIADDNDPSLIIPEVKQKIGTYTSVGSRYETNLELISSLQPDLIIADLSRHKEIYDKLTKIAPTIVVKSLGADYKSNLEAFPVIAEAVGASDKAKQLISDHQKRMEELKKRIPADEKRTVLPAVASSTGFFAHTNAAYAGSLLEQLGYKDAIQGTEAYPKVTLEQLVTADPDILFIMKSGDKTVIDEWKSNPLWTNLKAVKNGQIHYVERNAWSLSRGLIAAETIADQALQLLYSGSK